MWWLRLGASISFWERSTDDFPLCSLCPLWLSFFLTTEDTEGHRELRQKMKFSDQFETRFAEMHTHYPTKRSALVPTLLYAQDEVGHLSDEVIAELAKRVDLTELEVRNVISYYSMLTTKPRGKYNVQVCTNIAC